MSLSKNLEVIRSKWSMVNIQILNVKLLSYAPLLIY